MTNVIQEPHTYEQKAHPFGVRLQSARETLGMDRKDAAAHLRVPEKVIIMLESGIFNKDLPLAFTRGYLRSYSKLLEIPEQEVKAALDLIKPKPDGEEEALPITHKTSSPLSSDHSLDSHNFFMTLFTTLIIVTLIGLVAVWWHSHKTTDSQITLLPQHHPDQMLDQTSANSSPSVNTNSIDSAINTGIEGVNFPTSRDTTHSPDTVSAEDQVNAAKTANMDILPTGNTDLIDTPPSVDTSQVIETTGTIASKNEPSSIPKKESWINLSSIKNTLAPYFITHGDKKTVEQAILGNHYLQLLVEFILFLFIINFGLRKYYHRSLIYVTGGTRPAIRTTPKPFRPLSDDMQFTPKYNLAKLFTLILVIGGLGWFSYSYWNKYRITAPTIVKTTTKPSNIAVKKPSIEDVENNLALYANLENLAPSSNLNAKLASSFKIYPIQSMVEQLNQYISQAHASNFALTDPSTDLGQITYPNKKKSRHRRKPIVVHTYSENIDPYNDTGTANYPR